MWKYLSPLVWAANAFWIAAQTAVEVPSAPTEGNAISALFGWADFVSKVTDRALWLIFLALILYVAWFVDKRKEKLIKGLQEEVAALRKRDQERTEANAALVHKATEAIEDCAAVMARMERNMDR